MTQCTATSKQSGERCKRAAADGSSKCYIHGGKTPRGADSPNLKHGRYSAYLKDSLKSKLDDVQAGDPLDLLPELEVQRVLLSDYLSRFQVGGNPTNFDIDFMVKWSAEIGRTVERMVKMKNETALTQAEVQFLAARIVELIGKYVVDPDKQRAFVTELLASVPALSTGQDD